MSDRCRVPLAREPPHSPPGSVLLSSEHVTPRRPAVSWQPPPYLPMQQPAKLSPCLREMNFLCRQSCPNHSRVRLGNLRSLVVLHLLVLNSLLPHRKGVSSFRLGASLLQEITEHVDVSDSWSSSGTRQRAHIRHHCLPVSTLHESKHLQSSQPQALTSSTTSFMWRVHTRLQESRNFAISS